MLYLIADGLCGIEHKCKSAHTHKAINLVFSFGLSQWYRGNKLHNCGPYVFTKAKPTGVHCQVE